MTPEVNRTPGVTGTATDDPDPDVGGDALAEPDAAGTPTATGTETGTGIRTRLRNLPPWVLPAAVVTLVVALPVWGMWLAPGPPMEEGFMLVFPERLLEGDLPNRDFLHLYGPGSLWALAGAFQVFGVDLWVERLVGLAQIGGLVAGIVVVNYRWGRGAAAIGGITTALVIMPAIGLTALAWVGGLALGLWACIVAGRAADRRTSDPDNHRPVRRLLILAGVLGGAALLYRPDLVVAVGLPFLALWLWGLDARGRRWLLGASLVGSSPMLVHLALAGPGEAIAGMVVEPVVDLRAGRTLNFPPAWNEYESFLNRAFLLRDWPWPLPTPDGPNQVVLWTLLLFACCALLVVVGVRARRHRLPGAWTVLAVALYAAGTLPQAIQRPDTAHLAWVSAVPFGLWPLAVAVWRRLPALSRPQRPAVLSKLPTLPRPGALSRLPTLPAQLVVPVVVMLAVIPTFTVAWYADYVGQTFGYNREGNEISHRGRLFYHGRPQAAAAAREMLADIEQATEPGDRLIVGTTGGPGEEHDTPFEFTPYSEVQYYFLLPQLEPGTRYIEMDPGVANAEDSELADELEEADVVILSSLYDDWSEPNDSVVPGSPRPAEVLAEQFCLHESYGTGNHDRPLYELHLRC